MRGPIARLPRIVDGWFPVRRMRMTGAVAAAIVGYVAMLVLQLSVVVPVPGEASTASPVVIGGGLLSISAEGGVCALPLCLLAPRCAASVGGGCLLPTGSPPPATPRPAPPAPPAAPPAAPAAAPVAPAHPAPAHPVVAARSASRAAAVHAAAAKPPRADRRDHPGRPAGDRRPGRGGAAAHLGRGPARRPGCARAPGAGPVAGGVSVVALCALRRRRRRRRGGAHRPRPPHRSEPGGGLSERRHRAAPGCTIGRMRRRNRAPTNSMGVSDLLVFVGVLVAIFALVIWLSSR